MWKCGSQDGGRGPIPRGPFAAALFWGLPNVTSCFGCGFQLRSVFAKCGRPFVLTLLAPTGPKPTENLKSAESVDLPRVLGSV